MANCALSDMHDNNTTSGWAGEQTRLLTSSTCGRPCCCRRPQLDKLRRISADDQRSTSADSHASDSGGGNMRIAGNIRPVQPSNGRPVRTNIRPHQLDSVSYQPMHTPNSRFFFQGANSRANYTNRKRQHAPVCGQDSNIGRTNRNALRDDA